MTPAQAAVQAAGTEAARHSEKQKAAARENGGKRGAGRPTAALTELKRLAREEAQGLLAGVQVPAVAFLIQVMKDDEVDVRERIKCALELLDRGENPRKSATYHGIGDVSELEAMFGTPKLVVTGKYGSESVDEQPH